MTDYSIYPGSSVELSSVVEQSGGDPLIPNQVFTDLNAIKASLADSQNKLVAAYVDMQNRLYEIWIQLDNLKTAITATEQTLASLEIFES